MIRTKEMTEYLKPYLVERMHGKIAEIKREGNDRILPDIKSLLKKACARQAEYSEWTPVYMGLFHLMTGLLTESHEYEMILADDQLYLDELKVSETWNANFFYDDRLEKEGVKKALQSKFYRLNDYEIMYMKHWIFYKYRRLMEVYWRNQLETVLSLEEFKMLNKGSTFSFLFGDYMGRICLVFKYEEDT